MPRHANKGLRKLCDCARRNWPKCSHSWYFNFKPRGGPAHRFSLDKHFNRHVDSKSEAEELAGDLRKLIRAGKFGQPTPRQAMTVRQLADLYVERYVKLERSTTEAAYVSAFNRICRTVVPRPIGGTLALGSWPMGDVVTDTIERFREVRRSDGGGVVAINRNLATLRGLFNWAVRVGYADGTPFKRHSEAVVKLSAETPRSRRLDANEELALRAASGPYLRALIEAALQTGMRRGELLSLQWHQVDGMKIEDQTVTWAHAASLVLPAGKTKTKRERRIPISTRLKGILEMRRFDPTGEPMAADRYVFGNEIGQRVQNFKRAWQTAVLRAHGYTPTYIERRVGEIVNKTANLAPVSRAALATIDLHYHDLRREAGSRWLEGGVPLHTVRDWLGHTNIAQTSTYLAGTVQTQHDAMRAFEARQNGLQKIARNAETGGQNVTRSVTRRAKKLNKDAVGTPASIM
jgi:integrase